MVLPPWDCHSELYSSSSTLTFGKQASWIAATLLLHPTEMTTAPFHPFSKTPALRPASEKKSLYTMSQKSTGVRWRRVQTVPAQYHAHEGLPPPQEGELHYPSHAELHLLWKQLTTAKPRPSRFHAFVILHSHVLGKVAARESSNNSLLLTQPPTVCSSLSQHESSPRG